MTARWTTAAASAVLAGIIGVATVQAGEVVDRERRQQERIAQGVQSGELTARETQRLEREQARIERDRKLALSDGKMTRRERARLHNKQDRASRHIYRQKHDAQRQPGAK